MPEKVKTTKMEILQFGLSGFSLGLNNNGLIAPFLMFFLIEIGKIPAAIGGTIFLLGKLIQIPCYPLIGAFYDRTNTRWGHYRPYMIFVTPVAAILAVLLFSVPDLSPSLKIIYYGTIYVLFCILHNATVGLAGQSLIPVLSSDRSTRNFVAMSRVVMGVVAQAGGAAVVIPLVLWYGGEAMGWSKTVITFEVVFVLGTWIAVKSAKRHDLPAEIAVRKQAPKLKDQLRVITSNKPLFFLVVAWFFMMVEASTTWSTAVYLYKYIIQQPQLISQIPGMQLPFSIALGVTLPFVFKKYLSKRTYFMLAAALAGIFPVVLLVFKPFSNVPLILGLGIFSQVMLSSLALTGWSILPDCMDYAEWKTGKKSNALVTSCFSLLTNIGSTMGGFLLGVVLSAIGYVGGTVPTPAVMDALFKYITIAPTVCTLIVLIFMKMYPITDKYYSKMIVELTAMRESKGNT